jgi:di/tricarboxylate transporter
MFVLFLGGAFFGLVITTIALWRSRAVPRGAVALIPVFIVVDLFLSQPRKAHVISFAGAIWIAWAVLRAGRPS